jgi:proline dehydrogenase
LERNKKIKIMNELLNAAAASLRKAAMNEQAKEYILHNEVLFKTLKKAANRYIGGENLDETVAKVVLHNQNGYRCGIEFMGENTLTELEAKQATSEFLKACDRIKSGRLDAAISLDLSHIGLSISEALCMENLQQICQATAAGNTEVTISAEATDKTDAVLDTYLQASKTFSNLSITLQAYLHRTKDDLREVIKRAGRIRLVKGAFETPAELSLPRGTALNQRYLELLDDLLIRDHKCAIATHDPYISSRRSS